MDALIARHDLIPHPEGGWYREVFRSPEQVLWRGETLAASTQILFLLVAGTRSRWHRIPQDEVWHHHAGALELVIATTDSVVREVILDAEHPVAIVPGGAWQAARPLPTSTTDHALVGCTVAPGFDFRWFELLPTGSEPPAELSAYQRFADFA